MFGKSITMTYDGETGDITTFTGGLISVLAILTGYVYLGDQTYIMFSNTKGVDYSVSD